MGENKAESVSIGKRKMGKLKHTSLRKKYNILPSGGNLKKHNYIFRIDTIKVVSLMQHLQEKLQMKAGRLLNVTIAGHNLKFY